MAEARVSAVLGTSLGGAPDRLHRSTPVSIQRVEGPSQLHVVAKEGGGEGGFSRSTVVNYR